MLCLCCFVFLSFFLSVLSINVHVYIIQVHCLIVRTVYTNLFLTLLLELSLPVDPMFCVQVATMDFAEIRVDQKYHRHVIGKGGASGGSY